ncbi:endonuclease VII domain-containing protein [Dactylosporangium vinaceum]|uniref:Endonuclease VII domain-containing protein n=1 Tax=Dactylosporangium vinaceum TaxID=53362 RepID=A0ABV5MCG7_9ACTN|nr:endonuclease VII domain-containing protein [Dactylosporangium vinaceum]UAB92167.1 endonuclease VII domain-containing protein [Dactylosporangium vinaceum]
MTDETVACRRCGDTQPRDAFYNQGHSSRPRQPCKQCLSVARRVQYLAGGGSRISHAQVLRDKYGLTPQQYDRMLQDQGGLCAICGQPETRRGSGGEPRRLSVDHDHRTGVVRQLLCGRCNSVTWAVEESPGLLEAVRDYLERHRRLGNA